MDNGMVFKNFYAADGVSLHYEVVEGQKRRHG